MKKKIALLLALAMVLTMIPMMSFAASGNTETIIRGGVPRVADDYDSEITKGIFQSFNSLIIREDNFEVGASSFQLRIENAKWSSSDAYSVTKGVYGFDHAGDYKITSRTDKVLDIELQRDIKAGQYQFEIPLYFAVDGNGPIQVTVDPLDSGITGGTFTVANAAKGATITTIDDVITFSEKGVLDPIRIEETSMGSLDKGTHRIKLRLPTNFEWSGSEPTIRFINGLQGIATAEITSFDGQRDFDFTLTINQKSGSRGAIIIEGAQVYAKNNAREGDVEVRISGGDVTSETILVAKYSDFDVTVKADGQPKELISGRFEAWTRTGDRVTGDNVTLGDSNFDDEAHELQTLIIEEEVADALLGNRRTRIDFPSWVKILGVDIEVTDAKVELHGVGVTGKDVKGTHIFNHSNRGESYIELTINPDNKTDEAKVELTFFVSVKADAEGDIVAEVSGRSGAEGSVVLGTTRRPVEMEIKGSTTVLDIGKKGQAIPEIIISEIEAEDLMNGDLVLNLSNGAEWNDYTVEVIEGDLELDKDNIKDYSGGDLRIPIKSGDVSTVPSTIRVSNATVDVDRTIADGAVNVRVRGAAARRNHLGESAESRTIALDAGYFDQNNVVSAKVGEVVFGGQNAQRDAVTLTIGQIPAGGDAAPYISNNRTYAPVSAVAQSLGINKNNIIWNEANRTVTIMGDKTVQMTIGSTTLLVNGTPVAMDVAPEITNSRTFLPIAWLAKALDVEYSWDAATQTVTFY